MIQNKEQLKHYLQQDKIALYKGEKKHPSLFSDEIWKFQIVLRKLEYITNCLNKKIFFIPYIYYKYKYHKMSVKLGFSIPINVFEEGLSIAHYGTIVVNSNAKVGKNCRIQENVTIGTTNGISDAPKLGNNIFIGSGAKIIGNINIPDDVAIGANSVVVKDVNESGITIAGVPAKKISDKNSHSNLNGKLKF